MDYRDVVAFLSTIAVVWGGIQLGYLFPNYFSEKSVADSE